MRMHDANSSNRIHVPYMLHDTLPIVLFASGDTHPAAYIPFQVHRPPEPPARPKCIFSASNDMDDVAKLPLQTRFAFVARGHS